MAKPKLALIPAAQGDKFYSVLPSDGVGDFDFTRNSSATRIAPTGFIQEVGAFGSELVTNGNFDNDSDWAKATGWSISGGKAIATAANNGADLVQNIGLVNGKSYKIEVTISGYVAGSLRMNFLGTGGNFGDFTANGTYIGYADGGNDQRLQIVATTTTTTLSIDNVSVKEVVGNKSRLNYDLLNGKVVNCPHYLLEPARTNVMLQSNQFDTTWAFTRASVSQGYLSPDGSLNAWAFIDNATDSTHLMVQSASLGAVTSTASMYVKAGTRDFVAFRFEGNTGVDYVYFDVKNGIIGDVNSDYIDVSMENAGNGWYRCIATRVLAASGNQFIVLSANANGDPTYAGNGDNALYIFGAQVEEGSYPTSYIPTTTTAITRAVESATGSGNAATFNSTEGVLMAEIAALANDGTNRFISLTNGVTDATNISLAFTTTNQIRILVDINYVLQMSITYTVNSILDFNKIILKYKENDFALWVNGFEIGTDTSGAVPTANYISDLSFQRINSLQFYGKTRELQYFDSALTDAQLETLTSWTSLQEMITSQLYTNY